MMASTFCGHNLPAARARELFKTSTHSGGLLVPILNKFSLLRLELSEGDVISGDVFKFLANLIWPWASTQQPFFASCLLETRLKSAPLESLIGFIAYLEPKLWLKNPISTNMKKLHKKVSITISVQTLASHNSAAD